MCWCGRGDGGESGRVGCRYGFARWAKELHSLSGKMQQLLAALAFVVARRALTNHGGKQVGMRRR